MRKQTQTPTSPKRRSTSSGSVKPGLSKPPADSTKKSLVSIDLNLVRQEMAVVRRHLDETVAECETTSDENYLATLVNTRHYYEGKINSLRAVLGTQFRPEVDLE